jgi:hypothetical protein
MNVLITLGYDALASALNPSPRERAILAEIRLAHLALDRDSELVTDLFERLESDFNIRFDLDRLDVEENLEEVRIMKDHWVRGQAAENALVLDRYLGWLHQCADAIGEEDIAALPANVKALVEARDDRDRLEVYLNAFREVISEQLGKLPTDVPLSHGELADEIIARLKSDSSQINELIAIAEGQKRAIISALGEALAKKLPDGSEQLTVIDAEKPWEELAQALVAQVVSLKAQLEAYERVGQGGEKPPAPVVILEKVEAKKPAPAPRKIAKPADPSLEESKPVGLLSQVGWPYLTSPEIMVQYVRLRANGTEHGRACAEASVHASERTQVSANLASTVQRAKDRLGIDREEYLDALLRRWQLRASIGRAA